MQSFSRRSDTPSWHVAQRFHTVFVSSKHLHKLGSNVGIPRAWCQTVTRAVQVQCSGYTSQVFKLCSRRALSRYQNKRLLLSVPSATSSGSSCCNGSWLLSPQFSHRSHPRFSRWRECQAPVRTNSRTARAPCLQISPRFVLSWLVKASMTEAAPVKGGTATVRL